MIVQLFCRLWRVFDKLLGDPLVVWLHVSCLPLGQQELRVTVNRRSKEPENWVNSPLLSSCSFTLPSPIIATALLSYCSCWQSSNQLLYIIVYLNLLGKVIMYKKNTQILNWETQFKELLNLVLKFDLHKCSHAANLKLSSIKLKHSNPNYFKAIISILSHHWHLSAYAPLLHVPSEPREYSNICIFLIIILFFNCFPIEFIE